MKAHPAILPAIALGFLTAAPDAHSADDPALRRFLLSTKGTYGWSPVQGTISYDFFPDGRLHIEGPDGEATMWQGKWKLTGDKLTITNSDRKTTTTVTVKIDGADLLLDGKRYKRYRPQ
ncbi:MAG: hypothetical protein ABMA13_21640 [Chthoniobacteraceae bacterium]